jgi:hypothetical protein
VHDDDLFEENGNCEFGTPKLKLPADLLQKLRAGPLPEEDDLTCDIVLTRLVHGELEAFGTGGKEPVSEPEIELARRTLRGRAAPIGHHSRPALAQLFRLQGRTASMMMLTDYGRRGAIWAE